MLIIYFSILNYIQEVHGFSFDLNINYSLIPTKVIKNKYIAKNFGARRLRQIKYKYFSDKALRIWELCYAFFDREHKISMKVPEDDYLLARNFEHIFEVMIDKLVSGDEKKELPDELKDQKDGKLVDHMYIDNGLLVKSDLEQELTYYIGDSKYYKRGKDGNVNLGEKSIYKQYTYARNVIQWNMNMFLRLPKTDVYDDQPQLRDDLTEGYNPIPNFFISAHIPDKAHSEENKFLSFEDDSLHNEENIQLNRQFENRLFDRDTLLLCHYDVNFLFIVSLYGRDNKKRQEEWREGVRKEFRKSIQQTLNKLYSFSILQPLAGKDCYGYIKENFHKLNGKIYRPQKDGNYLILALMKKDFENADKIFGKYTSDEIENNEALKEDLKGYFDVRDIEELKENLIIADLPNAGTLEKGVFMGKKTGVLLVKTDDYAKEYEKFSTNGKYAICTGISDIKTLKIAQNLQNIGYVMFVQDLFDKHLFALKDYCDIKEINDIEDERPRNGTSRYYITIELDLLVELDSSKITPVIDSKSQPVYADLYDITNVRGGK